MAKPLIIVESPTKARTIKKFLPARYAVKASVGHVRDLPKSTLGVDVEHGFQPKYLTIKGKGDVIKELRAATKAASDVFLATDPDREGESIAWHLAELLKLEKPKRIELHEITKEATLAALKEPQAIDVSLVNAQQARRILDRLVGYKISPLLWAKVRGGLSAGRVQSVAVRLIVDREREIAAFVPKEYWSITAQLAPQTSSDATTPVAFPAEFFSRDGEKLEIGGRALADEIVAAASGAEWRVESVKQREQRRNPAPPFTTSTLQQEASRRLKIRVRRAMQLAQALYEGVDLGAEGTVGLITYMRTDSTRIADAAREQGQRFITATYGSEYVGPYRAPRLREGAQDAHEAIRPTSVERTPERMAPFLKRDELRLYKLIWERFVASQMAAAVYDQTTVDIAADGGGHSHLFRATGSVLKFPGFTAVYEEGIDEALPAAQRNGKTARPRVILPQLAARELLDLRALEPKQHFTEPPPRYTEATLVRALEENGLGRPSTYSSIVETVQARGYVIQLERRFHPTEIGIAVNDLLVEHFPDIVDVGFTATMEQRLDRIEESPATWEPTAELLAEFYAEFKRELDEAEKKLPKLEMRDEPTDEICPNCGRPMVIKTGRFGRFISCTGYPECKTTRPILKDTGAKCPKDGGMIVERKSRKGRIFYGCANYPACDFVSWDRVVPEPCPVCGAYVVAKTRRGGAVHLECSTDRAHDLGRPATDGAEVEAESDLEHVPV
ncbi:MAG: type I DNA topoisomerase [Candidatus Eremiobacteraeota bacterium]|nr:type I DNA topoisomerase [Candidatus Eremiobacteraeota bacterium]